MFLFADALYEALANPFLIYYGYPSGLKAYLPVSENTFVESSDYEEAYSFFKVAVLPGDIVDSDGDNVPDTSHPDYTNVQNLVNTKGDQIEFFGYINLGLKGEEKTISQYKSLVDAWQALSDKLKGIFVDEAGFDYSSSLINNDEYGTPEHTYRARQKEVLEYIHEKGLKAFFNPWNPDDVLGDYDEKGNYNPLPLEDGDAILWESFIFADSDEPAPVDQVWEKGMKIYRYKKKHPGFRVFAVARRPQWPDPHDPSVMKRARFMLYLCYIFGIDYFYYAESYFGATQSEGWHAVAYNLNVTDIPQNCGNTFKGDPQRVGNLLFRETDRGVFRVYYDDMNAEFQKVLDVQGSGWLVHGGDSVVDSKEVSFKISSSTITQLYYTVFNWEGKLMEKGMKNLVPGENEVEIDVSRYPAGVYFVLFRDDSGAKYRVKFIKVAK